MPEEQRQRRLHHLRQRRPYESAKAALAYRRRDLRGRAAQAHFGGGPAGGRGETSMTNDLRNLPGQTAVCLRGIFHLIPTAQQELVAEAIHHLESMGSEKRRSALTAF